MALLWCDLETTSLDPSAGRILEVGLIATTDDLTEVWRTSLLCRFDLASLDGNGVSAAAREMHAASGLWNDCADALRDMPEVAEQLVAELRSRDLVGLPMCGSTIGFDRSFLKAQMPALAACFHYRSIDVSTLTELARRWYPMVYSNRPGANESKRPHRALQDLEVSIALLKYYRKTMMSSQASAAARLGVL